MAFIYKLYLRILLCLFILHKLKGANPNIVHIEYTSNSENEETTNENDDKSSSDSAIKFYNWDFDESDDKNSNEELNFNELKGSDDDDVQIYYAKATSDGDESLEIASPEYIGLDSDEDDSEEDDETVEYKIKNEDDEDDEDKSSEKNNEPNQNNVEYFNADDEDSWTTQDADDDESSFGSIIGLNRIYYIFRYITDTTTELAEDDQSEDTEKADLVVNVNNNDEENNEVINKDLDKNTNQADAKYKAMPILKENPETKFDDAGQRFSNYNIYIITGSAFLAIFLLLALILKLRKIKQRRNREARVKLYDTLPNESEDEQLLV